MNNQILNKEDFNKVTGHIYIITNLINNHQYIGQTRSHRLNKNKYRPFGFIGRFKDHINECNTNKKNYCKYLNNSLIKYGYNNFKCELIIQCDLLELDKYEQLYIAQYNTLFPNGYNLTRGGKMFSNIKDINLINEPINIVKKSIKKTEYTKNLISHRLKEHTNKDDIKIMLVKNAVKQHYLNKFKIFEDVKINNLSNLNRFIYVINNNKTNTQYVRVKINNKSTNFIGKYDDIDILKKRALDFVKELINKRCNQIAGNP
jgi:hypothetical protein